jgi:glucosamine-6-phosphate deaminase
MTIDIFENSKAMGIAAGKAAAAVLRTAIETRENANIILATGTSQFEVLNQLLAETDINWTKVTMFHLDEYIGLPDAHPASFRKYLKERFIEKVTFKAYHLINAETDPEGECERLGKLILAHPIDVALVGIGENGHLAFNDPPADFDTESPYIIVDLDEPCRRQQLGEGWFPSLEAVPKQAISMSIRQIMKSASIICSVPDERKAQAVKNCLEQGVSNLFPASILQQHTNCRVFLDAFAGKYLEKTNA